MKIKIIGAGFSGLTLAYYLRKMGPENLQIQVLEKSDRAGGLIQTKQFDGYMLETAANAILCNADLEELCHDIQIPLKPHLKSSKKRYIYIQKPRQFPLPITHFCLVLMKWLWRYFFHRSELAPKSNETIVQWTRRNLSSATFSNLIEPALQGIYGKNPGDLSASLVYRSLFSKASQIQRPKLKGSVSFQNGLGGFLSHLQKYLQEKGVDFQWSHQYTEQNLMADIQNREFVVLCTHALAASQILSSHDPKISFALKNLRYNNLSSVTVVQEQPAPKTLQGFGVLFPTSQNFNALGVLFPNDIFEGRGPCRHETWILADSTEDNDATLLEKIQQDRRSLFKTDIPIKSSHIYHWPQAIPRYDEHLELFLNQFEQKAPVFLHGNYLGEIGLGKILKRSKGLATIITQQTQHQKKENL